MAERESALIERSTAAGDVAGQRHDRCWFVAWRSIMRCDEVMSREIHSVRQRDTVLAAAKLMRSTNVGFLPVSDDDGRIIGALTDRDIVVRLAADGRDWHTVISEVMTRDVISCRPDDSLELAEQLMRDRHTGRVVCLDDDGHAQGVVSLSDVSREHARG